MRKPYPTDRPTFPTLSGSVCDRTCLPQRPREDHAPTPYVMSSTPSSMFSKAAVLGDFCPTTSLLGLPFTTTSENCALAERGLSYYRTLRNAERKRVGKNPDASTAIMDSQSVKTTEEGAQSNGYDAHKNIKGRKRHLLVDTLGLPLSVYVTSADVQDRVGTRSLLAGLKPFVPRLKKIWADGAYTGEKLASWLEEQGGWELEIVERDREARGFEVLSKRWIVERTFSWLIRNRRLSKDYERMVQSSETFMKVAMIRLILRRLARAA